MPWARPRGSVHQRDLYFSREVAFGLILSSLGNRLHDVAVGLAELGRCVSPFGLVGVAGQGKSFSSGARRKIKALPPARQERSTPWGADSAIRSCDLLRRRRHGNRHIIRPARVAAIVSNNLDRNLHFLAYPLGGRNLLAGAAVLDRVSAARFFRWSAKLTAHALAELLVEKRALPCGVLFHWRGCWPKLRTTIMIPLPRWTTAAERER
jgi:hypothetical protein